MATQDWSAAYEAVPANTESVSSGDDRIRDFKRDTRERMQQGGHLMQELGVDNVRDGRHAVDAGGAGVSPDIFKSDKVSPLVEYTDVLVRIYEILQLDKQLDAKDRVQIEKMLKFAGSARVSAGSGATVLGDEPVIVGVDTSGGNATITLPDVSAAKATGRVLFITKRIAANSVTLTPAALNVLVHPDGSTGSKTYTSGRVNAWICVTVADSTWMVFEMNTQGEYPGVINVTNANASPAVSDDFVFITTTVGGARTITLHAASAQRKRGALTVRMIDVAGGGTGSIALTGADTLTGSTTIVAGGTARFYPNTASNWVRID